MRSRRGFSFIELLTVMIVIGILASIAILRYRDFTNEALAARIATDMETVRLAALNHYSETSNWPGETADGQVPAELVRYLPDGWRFSTGSYSLDWENLGGVVGVTVRSDREGLSGGVRPPTHATPGSRRRARGAGAGHGAPAAGSAPRDAVRTPTSSGRTRCRPTS